MRNSLLCPVNYDTAKHATVLIFGNKVTIIDIYTRYALLVGREFDILA